MTGLTGDQDRLPGEVDIIQLDPRKLRDTHAGVQDLDDRPVPPFTRVLALRGPDSARSSSSVKIGTGDSCSGSRRIEANGSR